MAISALPYASCTTRQSFRCGRLAGGTSVPAGRLLSSIVMFPRDWPTAVGPASCILRNGIARMMGVLPCSVR